MTAFPFSSAPARAFRLILVALALVLAAAAFAATTAHAAGIVVNDAGDTTGACATTGTGTCTLRDAITFANSNPDADTITFDIPSGGACSATNTCTITLGSTLPTIFTDVTIDGAPNSGHITLSGNDSHRIMFINGGTTNLNALTFDSGFAQFTFDGGAIRSSIFSGTITLNISNSTFSRNHTDSGNSTTGGAISARNTILNITNSTFSGNYSSTIFAAFGGAVYNENSTATITNSTFSGNSAANGGAIATGSGGTTTLKNTIIANSPNGGNCNGPISADDYNIADDSTCDNADQYTTAEIALGALADNGGPTQTMAIDENSAAWDHGDNAVCAAAPVNNLDQRGETRPQGWFCDTGAYEFVYSGWQTGPNFVVNSSADTEDGSCDVLGQGIFNQDCTLREAILAANALGGADTITFNIPATDSGCTAANTCTITLGDRLPIIQFDPLTIDGAPNSGRITVDGAGSYTVFDAETDFNLNALTVQNGSGLLKGAGLHISDGDVLVSNSTFVNNSAQGGGHIKNLSSGTVTIVNSTFFDTPTTGIGNNEGTMLFYNSTLNGNNLSGSTGVEAVGGTVTLYNTIVVNHEFQDCYAPPSGGTLTADSFNIDEDGTCDSATSKTLAELNLQALADNGGPTQTIALGAGSAAIDTGDDAVCAAAPVNGLDQRGVTRPQGVQCDVGAYEAAVSCPAFPISVANEGELNTAIGCYNAETVAGSYTISVTQGISLTASTTTIDNTTSGVALVIEGNGHAVDGQGTSGVRPFTIEDDTTVTLKNMTITRGNTQDGAGISNSGTLTILNSTVSYNQATRYGGGIDNGGALYVVNSTVSHNVASNQTNEGLGGGIYNGETLTVVNSTISDNTSWILAGGIDNAANTTITLHNSIVANNTNNSGPADCNAPIFGGTVTAQNSLVETGTIGNGCLIGSNNLTGDPNLGPLQNNGGPTETHALLPSSIAVNAGANALAVDPGGNPLPYDQRGPGFPRILGGTVDMGAYEFGCPVFPVGVATEGQLNYAIACYNAETVAGSYTISVTQGISLTASTTAIDNATSGVALVIEGNGHTVDGQNTSGVRPFTIEDDTTVTLKTMTITRGNTQDGAGISNSGTLTILNSTVSYNQATRYGGGIDNGGTLYLVNSTVSHNVASNQTNDGQGGGIYNGGTLTVVNSTISNNEAYGFGGGIGNQFDTTMTLHNSIVANNTAFDGLDCYASVGGTTEAQNSLVETGTIGSGCLIGSNNLTGDPNLGPLQNNGGPTETHALLPASIAINAGANALAVDPDNNPLTTDQRGPGFPRINGGTVDMGAYEFGCPVFPVGVATEGQLNYAITCYNAETVAGSYTIIIAADIDLTASTTTINNATSGVELVIEGNGHTVDGQGTSGVRPFTIEDDTTVTLKTMTVTGGNTQFGGGISNDGTLTILNSTISYNRADSTGGGIDNGGTLYLVNSTVSHNVASNQTNSGLGGGIWNGGTVTVVNSTISDNEAWTSGGGINNVSSSTITLHNSIVANNTAYEFPDCSVTGSVTRSAQNSLVETGTIGDGCLIGSNNLTGDPNLGPLQNNGGPTETHALLPGSIAINAGANALAVDPGGNLLPYDQRGPGFLRINGGTVDMGAYETISSPTAVTLSGLEAASQQQAVPAWPYLLALIAAGAVLALAGYRRSRA